MTIDELKSDADAAIAIGPFGSRMKANCYVVSGVPVIRGNNLSDTRSFRGDFVCISEATADSMRSSNVFADDLVFPHRGAIGEVGIVPQDGKRYMLSTSLMKLSCNRRLVSPQFLFYFFRSVSGRHELLKYASTVGTPGIGQPLTSLRSIRVQLPPRAEQDRIADILGSLDDKIELNRRTNETLEATARALFKSWFVDFDPVQAKLEGRQIAGMDKAAAAIFPGSLQDSPLGKIPKGWRVATMPEVLEINPVRSLRKGAIAPYLEMSNLPTRLPRAVAWENRPFGSGTKFMNGDTLVARITPCLENGKTAYVDFLGDGQVGAGSTEYIILRPKPPLPTTFAYYLARNEDFRQHLITNMTGTSGRQRAPADSLNSFRIVVPPENLARHFGEFTANVLAQIKTNDEEAKELATARDSLLPRLLSGELSPQS